MRLSCHITGLRRWLRDGSTRYPAAPLLGGICAGIICNGRDTFLQITALLLVTFAAILLPKRPRLTILTALSAGALVSACSRQYPCHLPVNGYGTLEAKVVDSSCGGEKNRWLPSPTPLTVAVQRYRPYGQDWQVISGRVALFLPRQAGRFSYGDIIQVSGEWQLPASPVTVTRLTNGSGKSCTEKEYLPGGFDYRHYLQTRNIYRCFVGRQSRKLSRQQSLLTSIIDHRNILMSRTVSVLSRPEQRGILAALLFGCRQGIPRSLRRNFTYSGTIHIFTVSGLHVGLLALLLLFTMRGLPFKLRYLLLPILLSIYVVSTGMHPPAVRAWLMLSIWAVCRAYLLYTPTLNVVFLSAALLLLYQPRFIADAGFQFSFVIVGFLVASGKKITRLLQLLFEYRRWIPAELSAAGKDWRHAVLLKLTAALLGCAVAWAVSSGLVLYYQGIYQPAAVVANFLIIPLVWLLFVAAAGCFITLLLPLSAAWGGSIIAAIITVMLTICDIFHRHVPPFAVPRPSLTSLLLFYLAAAVMVSCRKVRTFFVATTVMGSIIIYWHAAALFMSPALFIVHGGRSQEPGIVLAEPSEHNATIINVPSGTAARVIINYLRSKGIYRIEKLIIAKGKRDFCAGAPQIITQLAVDSLIIPGKQNGRYLRRSMTTAHKQHCRIITAPTHHITVKNINKTESSFAIDMTIRNRLLQVKWSNNGFGERKVEVTENGKRLYLLELRNCNQLKAMELMLPL